MTRHIVVVTLGTYGDVLTRVALAEALLRNGAAVTIVTYEYFRALVCQPGAEFRPVPGDPRKVIDNAKPETYDGAASGNPDAYAAALTKHIEERRECALSVIDAAYHACSDADLVVYWVTSGFAVSIAEAYSVPSLAAFNAPLTPTDKFASVIAPVDQYARPYFTKASHRRSNRRMGQSYTPLINFWRHDRAGLVPIPPYGPLVSLEKTGADVLYGCSPVLVPLDPSWPQNIKVTGPWRPRVMPSDPPTEILRKFIADGPPPIVIGYSSAKISPEHQGQIADAVRAVIAQRIHRFVILSGWMDLAPPDVVSDRVLTLPEAPHDWLFPKAGCVVHAGGAGTAHAQLSARVPGVIVPLWGDQYFWARRMAAAGRAIDAGRPGDLTGKGLVLAIDRAMALDRSGWLPEPDDGSDIAARCIFRAVSR